RRGQPPGGLSRRRIGGSPGSPDRVLASAERGLGPGRDGSASAPGQDRRGTVVARGTRGVRPEAEDHAECAGPPGAPPGRSARPARAVRDRGLGPPGGAGPPRIRLPRRRDPGPVSLTNTVTVAGPCKLKLFFR